jgi:Tfp pilus assembly protein PilF
LPDADRTRGWLGGLALTSSEPAEVQFTAAQVWLQIALVSGSQSDLAECLRLCQPALTVPALRAPAHALLGSAHQQSGNHAMAIEAFRIAAAERPDDPEILNNLAYAMAGFAPTPEAVNLAERAVALTSRSQLPPTAKASYLETLGFAQARLRRFEEAKKSYVRGLALNPSGLDLTVGLLEASIGLGELPESRDLLARVDRWAPGGRGLSPHLSERVAAARHALNQ